MEKYRYYIYLLTLLFSYNLPANEIVLVADEWCPYNCAPNSDKPGYVVEIAELVFAEADHTIIYKNVPWSRAILGVKDGLYTGAIAGTPKEIPTAIFHDVVLGFYGNEFVVLKESEWKYENINSLKDVRLAVIQDYNYGGSLNSYIARGKKIVVYTGNKIAQRVLESLLLNRIDAYVEDANVIYYAAKEKGLLSKIRSAGQHDEPIPVQIAFTPKDPNSRSYADILSKGIIRLRKEGVLQNILKKYGVPDWK